MTPPDLSLARALALHQQGRYADAAVLYRAVLDAEPDHPDALHLLGLAQRRLGNLVPALELVQRAVALRGDFIPALVNLGDMLLEAGRPAEAADSLGRAAGLDAGNASIWHALARALLAAGRAEEAIAAYRQAVARDPMLIAAQIGLNALLLSRGRSGEAQAAFAAYRRAVPADPVVFRHIPARRWCRPVTDPATLLAEPDTLWVARAGETLPVTPPVLALDDDDLTAPGFAEGQTVDLRNHSLTVGDTFVAHLQGVTIETVSRLHGLRGTFNLFVDRGLALADAYHDEATTERLLRFTGETVHADIAGRRTPLDAYDAVAPDQTVAGPALLLASRYIHHNYFHWMFEGVTRLWALEALPGGRQMPLLVPPGLNRSFHRDVLAALGVNNPMVPMTGTMVRAERLYFPSFLGPGAYSAVSIQWLRQRLLPAFGVTPWPRGGRRLYLSRSDTGVRSLVNEEILVDILHRQGFEVVVPGRMSVSEQIRTFAEAAVVVAPHGAGNTNMLFAPPGALLLELVPTSTRALLYWITAGQAGQRYGRMLCPEEPASGRLVVEPERFRHFLDLALTG